MFNSLKVYGFQQAFFISKEAFTAEWRKEKEERERGLHWLLVRTRARARRLANFAPITTRTRGTGKEAVTTHSPPAEQYKEAARLCQLLDAQEASARED